MFENLKAFIRQGKQANRFKRRDSDTEFPTPVTYESNSGYPSHLPPCSDFDELQISNDDLTISDRQQNKIDNYTNNNSNNNNSDTNNENTAHHNNYKFNNEDYEQVASQIVQQERLDKQKSNTLNFKNLDNYQFLEQMGEGAFSIVYKAKHIPSNTLVAIKILRKFQMDSNQKHAVLKEVTIMRQLNHPNIVRFIEFIDCEQYYYIVQELAVGGEIFASIVKYTYLSEDLSRHVIYQLAHAIRYLHEEIGLVHRDIKPENILFNPIEFKPSINPISKLRKSDDPNTKRDEGEFIPGVGGGCIGQIKLADFGLSKQIWEYNTKTPCGTVGYTAPEIVRDEQYSKEVDMWAIGCVLYTLLCGFPPFYDERIETLTEKVARGEYSFLSPWWDEISQDAKYCVTRLLTVDPSKRYTIDDFLNDPWVTIATTPKPPQTLRKSNSAKHKLSHPLQSVSKRSDNYSGMYSPAAIALRDAFDISSAVHRIGEEAALSKKVGKFDQVLEEEEMEVEGTDAYGRVISNPTHEKFHSKAEPRVFDLNLNGASILERRMNKNVAVKT